jgi:hypothetical protein
MVRSLEPAQEGRAVGKWRYADAGGCFEGEQALELAFAAQGKRNLFHDDVILQLEDRLRPLDTPPLVAERRLLVRLIPGGWPHLAGEAQREWLSEPILLLAVRSRWVWRQRVNEISVRAVGRSFFERIHEELHAASASSLPEAPARALAG